MSAAERLPVVPVREIRGQTPPHAPEAERAVLSTLLIKPSALDEVAGIITSESFYAEANGTVFEAIQWLAHNDRKVDLVTVATWLKDRDRLGAVGGAAYLAELIDATPAIGHVEEHARAVAIKHRRRRIIAMAHEVLSEGYGDVGDEDEWTSTVESRFVALVEKSHAKQEVTIGSAIHRYWKRWEAETDGSGRPPPGGRFGIRDLDDLLGPLRGGKNIVIGGRWGDGKTALGLQAAIATAIDARPPGKLGTDESTWPGASLVISTEMSDEELAQRALFSAARVDGNKAKPGRHKGITEAEWRSLTAAASDIGRLPVWIDDRPEITPTQIHTSVRRHKTLAKRAGRILRVVVVDYLQLINGKAGRSKGGNREEEVAYISRSLKKIAKSENVCIIPLVQLNFDPTKKDARPTAHDIRESKAIAMDADEILLIYNAKSAERAQRKHRGDQTQPESAPEEVELITDKQRGGSKGTVDVMFFPALTRFDDKTR